MSDLKSGIQFPDPLGGKPFDKRQSEWSLLLLLRIRFAQHQKILKISKRRYLL